MRIAVILPCLVFGFLASGPPARGETSPGTFGIPRPPIAVSGMTEDITLEAILEKSAAYCERVKEIALLYVCQVHLNAVQYKYKTRQVQPTAWGRPAGSGGDVGTGGEVPDKLPAGTPQIKFDPRGRARNRHLYDYQLINKDGELAEQWTLLQENGRKKNQDLPSPKDIRFTSRYLVMGPVGFLAKSWQDRFRYKIVGREILEDHEALIIHCEPRIRGGDNDNTGRIWVYARDGTILQIEWEPSSIQGYRDTAPPGYSYRVTWTVTYGVEQNGIRFPSRQFIREFLVDGREITIPLEETEFDYRDYKFFTVGVEIKYVP
jgi:hypothetical protein